MESMIGAESETSKSSTNAAKSKKGARFARNIARSGAAQVGRRVGD